MTKIILFALLILMSGFSFAQEESVDKPISTDLVVERKEPTKDAPILSTDTLETPHQFDPRGSHWLVSFGFEGLKYEVPWEFEGQEETFSPTKQELWGGRLGVGGGIYLGGGFNTTTKLDGFYVGTLFSRVLNAGPQDEAEEFAYIKRTGNVYGIELSQSLGWMFDFKTKNPFMDDWSFLVVEPFIEAGIGRAWAYNRINYDYDTGNPPGTDEGYRESITDEIMNTKIGGGVNFTANTGYFFYMKAFVNNFDILERKTTRYTRANQGNGSSDTETTKSAKIDPITTYAIGGGYKF